MAGDAAGSMGATAGNVGGGKSPRAGGCHDGSAGGGKSWAGDDVTGGGCHDGHCWWGAVCSGGKSCATSVAVG
eukprot:5732519-Alexandrium_andersonii.AAC.1